MLVLTTRPRYDYDDENSYSAALFFLGRPIRYKDAIIYLASFVICTNVVRSALDYYNFANVGIDRSASISYFFG